MAAPHTTSIEPNLKQWLDHRTSEPWDYTTEFASMRAGLSAPANTADNASDYELLADAPSAADCTPLPVTAQERQVVQTARHVDNLVTHWPAVPTVTAPYSTPERPAETTEFGSSARRGPLSQMPFTGSLIGIIEHRQSEPLKDRNQGCQ
jgi:hypothetical protein